jgi:hypothetical protein
MLEMNYESFKRELLEHGKSLIERWAKEYGSEPIPMYVLDDETIAGELLFFTAAYLRKGTWYADITGPAILIAEAWLKSCYTGATRTGRFDLAKDVFARTLAHEYAHHLKVIKVPESLRMKWSEIAKRMEISANTRATLMTGKTVARERFEFFQLTGTPIRTWVLERFRYLELLREAMKEKYLV